MTEDDAVGLYRIDAGLVVLDIQLRQGNGLNVRRLRAFSLTCGAGDRADQSQLSSSAFERCRRNRLFFDKATELHRVAEVLGAFGNNSTGH